MLSLAALSFRRLAATPLARLMEDRKGAAEPLWMVDGGWLGLFFALFGGVAHGGEDGYPDPVQGPDMDLECQLVSNGLYCGDSSGYQDPRAEELKKGAADWKLLVQMDSDDDLGVTWGDVGMLYFWIRHEDARQKNFDSTWVVLQCS
jgi:hypothetical protein